MIFITGKEYYDYLIHKNQQPQQLYWYEKLYIYYYENIVTVTLIYIIIIVALFYNNHIIKLIGKSSSKQSGGSNSIAESGFKLNKSPGGLISRVKSVASTGLRYGNYAGDYAVEGIKSNGGFFSKAMFFIFIGVGFTVYIFPVIALFLIGALTFLLVRKTFAEIITS